MTRSQSQNRPKWQINKDYKFLFNYLQLWRSYAILSVTTQWIFTFH